MAEQSVKDVALLREEHLPEVAELERLCFSEPWSENALGLLTREGGLGVVALVDGQVAAYAGLTYVLDEGSITNVAVHPDLRRRGLGRAVVEALLTEARTRELAWVFLEVRESNEAARGLYEGLGFRVCGIRKNFYRKPTESAYQMVWDGRESSERKKDTE